MKVTSMGEKMAIILPTGQWYAPSAVINDAYPEVTLDNFSFPVDSHLAARLVVLWPPMAKVTIDKVKNVF